MMPVGPAVAREVMDRLESAIVDPQRAMGAGDVGDYSASDETQRVPGSPEPPD